MMDQYYTNLRASKNNKHYTFISRPTENDQFQYVPPNDIIKYYQMCGLPHPVSGLHEIRIVYINGVDEIETYKTFKISHQKYEQLVSSLRDGLYKIYPTMNLDYIALPTCNDMQVARSPMINIDSEYYGYAMIK
jgi:hypothetical protein